METKGNLTRKNGPVQRIKNQKAFRVLNSYTENLKTGLQLHRENNFQSRILYPAKLSITCVGRIKIFLEIQSLNKLHLPHTLSQESSGGCFT